MFTRNQTKRIAAGARRLAAVALVGASACFPAITHGARVEDGFIIGATGGLASGPTHVEGDEGGIRLREPVIGPFVGYGVAPSRKDVPRFYIGAAVPVFFPLTQLDAYLQLPPAWTGPIAVGGGVVASLDGATFYGMTGGQLNESAAWHLGAGYGSRSSSSSFQSSSNAWVGSGGIEMASGYLRTQLFLQFATGEIPGPCFGSPETCNRGQRTSAAALGISLGRHEHNATRKR